MSSELGTIGKAIYEAYASRYPDGLVDTRDAAGILRLRPTYLETMRAKGGGPEYVRMGARVYYQLRTLAAWAESRVQKIPMKMPPAVDTTRGTKTRPSAGARVSGGWTSNPEAVCR